VDTLKSPWYGALLGALAALLPGLLMWGFTVDDALISVRYAMNVVAGHGWRFDVGSAPTDGVTPLPWVPLLLPFAHGDPLDVLVRAKVLGLGAWTVAAAALGVSLVRRSNVRLAAVALGIVALAFPIGAWSASGMETGVATALCTAAAFTFERPRLAAIFAGLAAAFRPELLPWALVVASGARYGSAPLAFAPFAACALVRVLSFGSPAPLAVQAKPSDLAHGAVYAVAAIVVVLTPILAARRPHTRIAKTLVIACIVHACVVVVVGGDWMPYARLLVPIAPSLAVVFVETAKSAPAWTTNARVGIAAVLGVILAWRAAPAGRGVLADRAALVRDARPVFANAKTIAALDIGWVSAAAPDGARIVDLAGLTDPTIAVLPGGHTSKHVDVPMLLDRGVDTVVIYSSPRVVEQRILRTPLFGERFERTTTLALGTRGDAYDVYVLRPR